MSLLAALRDHLVLDAAVRDLVGQRVYRGRAPAGTSADLPYVTLRTLSTLHEQDLEGEIDVKQSIVQVDCWAPSPVAEEALSKATYDALKRVRRKIGSGQHHVFLFGRTIERDEQIEEPPVDASDRWVFRGSRDYRMTWKK